MITQRCSAREGKVMVTFEIPGHDLDGISSSGWRFQQLGQ